MFRKPTDGGPAKIEAPDLEEEEADVKISRHRPTIKGAPPQRATAPSASSNSAKSSAKGDPANSHSVIDEWLTMRGDIETDGNIQVKGRVHGNITCISIIVEDGAVVDGEIKADDVIVRGHTSGTISANIVKLESSAVVESDIFHQSFACEQGARIEGRLSFRNRASEAKATPAAAPMGRAGSKIVENVSLDGGADLAQ